MSAQQLRATVVNDAAQVSRLRGRLQIWLLLLVPVLIVGGWWYPYLGFVVPVVMLMGMVGGFFRGRWVCGWGCPRGSFLERIMRRLSLNPGDPEHWGRVFWLMCTITTSVGVILAVLFWPRTWCAFCPVGTFAGTIGGRKRPLQIEAGCRECRACEAACPFDILHF